MRRTTSTSRLRSGSRPQDVAPDAPPRSPASPLNATTAVPYTAPDTASAPSDLYENVSAGISGLNLGPKSFAGDVTNSGDDATEKATIEHIAPAKGFAGFAEGERVANRSARIQAAYQRSFPANPRRFSPPASLGFLEACFLCKRRLRPGNDIFMYRGDQAFCSIECRCHQIEADERKEKCRIASVKKGTGTPPSNPTTNSQQVGSSETAAVA